MFNPKNPISFVKSMLPNVISNSQKITYEDFVFGVWDTSELITSDFARGLSRNIAEFWLSNFRKQNLECIISKDPDEVLEQAAADHTRRWLIFSSLGSSFESNGQFLQQLIQFIKDQPNVQIIGHILDRKQKWYELHPQCFVLDLRAYRNAGSPYLGTALSSVFSKTKIERSADNIHDDYTPLWIKKTPEKENYTSVCFGHNLLQEGLDRDWNIIAFPENLRASKYFLYPTQPNEFPLKLFSAQEIADYSTNRFFLNNTESIEHLDFPGPLDDLIIPASGLLAFGVLFLSGFNLNCRVNFFDCSPVSLRIMRKLINDWDGTNYVQFIERQIGYGEKLAGQKDAKFTFENLVKLVGGHEKWLVFWGKVRNQCRFTYTNVDILNSRHTKKLIEFADSQESSKKLLWLSNIYDYGPSALWRSESERINCFKRFIREVQKIAPEMYLKTSTFSHETNKSNQITPIKDFIFPEPPPHKYWTNQKPIPKELKQFEKMNSCEQQQNLPKCPPDILNDHSKLFDWIENESLLPWLKLQLEIPHKDMLLEALQCLPDFVPHRNDHNFGWDSVCLHGISPQHTEDFNRYGYKSREDACFSWTSIANRCPVTVKWLKDTFPHEEYHRVRFMLLKPGGYIMPHTDLQNKRQLAAINIALNQPTNCKMILEKYGPVPWMAGDVRRLDIGVKHAVYNASQENRIHLIIHGRPGNKYDHWKKLVVQSYFHQVRFSNNELQ